MERKKEKEKREEIYNVKRGKVRRKMGKRMYFESCEKNKIIKIK